YVSGTPTVTVTLTVEAGVQVRFNQFRSLNIGYGTNRGALRVLGTAASPVTFTSSQASPPPRYWARLYLSPSTDSAASLIRYATVQYGGYGSSGLLTLDSASPSLQNIAVRQSS